MKKFLSVLYFLLSWCLYAENSTNMYLRGSIRPTFKTKVIEFQISNNTTQVLFSTQNNSKYSDEGPKFEFSGTNLNDSDIKIKKLSSQNNSNQYEILITEKKLQQENKHPIFLKISAN
jgi:hypothetical protein